MSGDSAATTTWRNESDPQKVSWIMFETIAMIAAAADPADDVTAAADSDCFVVTSTAVFPSVAAATATNLCSIVSVLIASLFAILFFADAIFSSVAPVI